MGRIAADAEPPSESLRPTNGRFIGLDPFAGNMQDPQSLHKYAYVHGDPIMMSDPLGQMGTLELPPRWQL